MAVSTATRRSLLREVFSFPNPVNEVAARTVAGGVVVLALITLVTQSPWVLAVIVAGFWARVLTGPTLSPLGRLATKVVAPRIGHARYVPGPPKRFAQAIGATFTTAALVAYLLGAPVVAWVLVGFIVVAATLESVFAICLGCIAFGALMRAGVIPDDVCEACNDLSLRRPSVSA
jgi:hypothetical protein